MDAVPGGAAAPSVPAPPPPFAALTHRDFRYYAAARFLATFAIQMQSVAVAFHVYAITQRQIYLAYVGLAQFLPIFSLSLVAGQIADRFDRRFILLACDVVFSACAVALYLLGRSPSPAAVLAILAVVGAARAFYGPAGSSFLPSLVPREHFTNAVTWQSTLWQAAAIGGPSLGGAIYAFTGAPGPVYIAAAGVLAVAGVLVMGVRVKPGRSEREPATLEAALAGVRYVWRNKILLGSVSLDLFAVFLGGATALLPVYATDLGVGPRGLGIMRSAPAIGAGITAVYLAFRPLGRRAGPKMLAGVAVFGAATIVFGLTPFAPPGAGFPLAVAMLALLGAADMVSVVVRSTLVQVATPHEVRGRVSAVNLVFIGASNELGEFESGALAEWLGTTFSVVFGGVGTLAVVALWTGLFPALRRIDRLDDVKPET